MWSIVILFIHIILPVHSETNCTHLREDFASSVSEFTACAISNSKPVTLCESCVELFIHIVDNYNNMKEPVDNTTRCIDKFVNLDRLQIIQTLYKNSYDLWNNAKCDECFVLVEGKLTPNKSDSAVKFDNNYQDFMKCVNETGLNDSSICSRCMDDYTKLNKFYCDISNENDNIGGCMDIVDLMNTTRSLWSKKCCKFRRKNESIFIASAIIVLILTLCFYVLVQFCSVKKTPIILQQRRFAESLSQTMRS